MHFLRPSSTSQSFRILRNGAKATAWEITDKRCPPAFFAKHTVTELESWSDLELEEVGRLTEPMRWDSASDKYLQIPWAEAFAGIAAELKPSAPKSVVFYASGRASLEAFRSSKGRSTLPLLGLERSASAGVD